MRRFFYIFTVQCLTPKYIQMKRIYLLLLLSLFSGVAVAQPICGFDQTLRQQLQTDPAFKERVDQLNQHWEQLVALKNNTAARMVIEGADTIYEIPAVIHVLHTGGLVGSDYNRSDADLIAWIDYLNDVFAGTWPDYPGPGSGGVKIPIRFVLAKRGPDCAATTGIVRVDASSVTDYAADGLAYGGGGTGATEASLKALSRWPGNQYYNIYVVNKINGEDGYTTFGSFIAGYAYFAGAGPATDGSFMLSYVAEEDAPTLPHEMGHAMGLYHTFEGADPAGGSCAAAETDCAAQGDRICDTEFSPSNLSDFPCPTGDSINMCTGTFYQGVQNNIMNYGSCLDRFTEGQRDRMVMQLLTYRSSLLNSLGTEEPDSSVTTVDPADCTVAAIGNPGNNFNMGPCDVTFNTIDYTSGGYNLDGDEFYIDHTENLCIDGGISTALTAGTDYTLSVSVETNPQRVKAYIDYNNDGTFDPSDEMVMNAAVVAAGDSESTTVSIPDSVVFDTPLRMRIISDFAGSADFGPCDDLDYGQSEDFAVTIAPSPPLPISLTQFDAIAGQCAINLSWSVAAAKDFSRFEIERSGTGSNFLKIAEVAYLEQVQRYSYNDAIEGNYFYRLKMIDKDGSAKYSPVRRTTVSCGNYAVVYPNPFSTQVAIDYHAEGPGSVTLAAYDITGKYLFSRTYNTQDGLNSIKTDMSAYVDGIYVLHIFNNYIHEQFMVVKKAE